MFLIQQNKDTCLRVLSKAPSSHLAWPSRVVASPRRSSVDVGGTAVAVSVVYTNSNNTAAARAQEWIVVLHTVFIPSRPIKASSIWKAVGLRGCTFRSMRSTRAGKIYKNRFASVSSTSLKEVVLTGVLSIPQPPHSNQVCDFCEW